MNINDFKMLKLAQELDNLTSDLQEKIIQIVEIINNQQIQKAA
ncbi:hypothetical protein [Neisseria sp. Dent CA1/247]|nr:hypothetical protein [Neisseria sp. Dent CA1/247]